MDSGKASSSPSGSSAPSNRWQFHRQLGTLGLRCNVVTATAATVVAAVVTSVADMVAAEVNTLVDGMVQGTLTEGEG